MNFPLRTAFAVSHRFWIVVSSFLFVSRNFLISSLISFFTHSLIACYSISMFLNVLGFFFLEICFSFQSLVVRENAWYDLNCLELVEACFVSYHVVYIFENVPCAFEMNVYFASLGWKALYISVKSISSRVFFNAAISLLIFCLEDLSIFDSGVLKSPTIIVLLSCNSFCPVDYSGSNGVSTPNLYHKLCMLLPSLLGPKLAYWLRDTGPWCPHCLPRSRAPSLTASWPQTHTGGHLKPESAKLNQPTYTPMEVKSMAVVRCWVVG